MKIAASVSSASVAFSGPDSDCQRRLAFIVASVRSSARRLPL
jgi:hypothetical protein